MFTNDLLHEFELGVWKMDLTHILRILYAIGGDAITTFNARYVAILFDVLVLELTITL